MSTPSADAVIDFRIPPEPHLSRVVREGVTEFARSHGVNDDDLAHFLTALGEALANAIEHSRASRPITIEVRVNAERVVAKISDEGVGFACSVSGGADLPGIDSERGRGLPIMRRCSDIFTIESTPGAGTAVVLGRYIRRITGAANVA